MGEILGVGAGLVKVGMAVIGVVTGVVGGSVLWLYRDKIKDARALMALLIMLMFIPVGASLVLQQTRLQTSADTMPQIVAVDVKKVDATKTVLYLTLSEPGFAFGQLEEKISGKTKVIVPLGGTEKRIGHTFEIDMAKSGGGKLTFTVNEQKVERVEEIR